MPLACRQPFHASAVGSTVERKRVHHVRCRRSFCTTVRSSATEPATQSVSRRLVCLGSLLAAGTVALGSPSSCAAAIPNVLSQSLKKQLEPYLSAPAEFLKTRQRANGGEIILAPIRASRQVLEAAEAALQQLNIYEPDPAIYTSVLSKVRRASLDCYLREAADNDSIETRATQITQKWVKIADPCTFRLIAKNVTSLLPKDQQNLKVKTYKELEQLIQSFQLLDDIVDMAQEGDGTARERVPGCLQFTLAHITAFENCILESLGFEPVLAT